VPEDVGWKRSMLPTVTTVLGIEMIRDGGSLTASFHADDGSKWLLFPSKASQTGTK
jgi:hypothetical protein